MKTGTRRGWITVIMGAGILCLLVSCAASTEMVKARNANQRASIRRMHDDALTELYRAKPGAKIALEGSAGYAVFSDFGLRNIYMEDARAMGVAIDNETDQETFMKMVQLQAGPRRECAQVQTGICLRDVKGPENFHEISLDTGARRHGRGPCPMPGPALLPVLCISNPACTCFSLTSTAFLPVSPQGMSCFTGTGNCSKESGLSPNPTKGYSKN